MKMNDRYLCKAKRVDNGEWIVGYLYRLKGQEQQSDLGE